MAPPRRPRRPPRPQIHNLVLLLALSALLSLSAAQNSTLSSTLTSPSTTTFTLSSLTGYVFYYPPSPYTLYLTLSLCSVPAVSLLPSTLPYALYTSNSTTNTQPGPDSVSSNDINRKKVSALTSGFANVTTMGEQGLWVGIWAPDDSAYGGTGNGNWTFELGLSNTAPLVVVDGNAGVRFDDTDQTHALVTTNNYSAPGDTTTPQPNYDPLFVPTSGLNEPLGNSLCYVRGLNTSTTAGAEAVASASVQANVTTRGFGGGNRVEYRVQGLERATNYTVWLMEDAGDGSTRLWDPVYFVTKTDNNCRLIHALPFCPQVAYSVPSPPGLTTGALISHYNATLQPSLQAFTRTLTTFPCNSTTFGSYSYVSTCDDCATAYLNWLCATTLPRCTDAPSNATVDTSAELSMEWTIPDSYQSSLVRSNANTSRTPYFGPQVLEDNFPALFNVQGQTVANQDPFPYSEVPPCLGTCQLVGARCPPFIGWGCPEKGGTGTAGYGQEQMVPVGDRMAGEGEGVGGGPRAGDRFGNVWCNSLGTDLQLAVQTSAAAGQARAGVGGVRVWVVVVAMGAAMLAVV